MTSNTAALEKSSFQQQQKTTYHVLFIIGLCHLLNDSLQSVIPAMFPILEKSMSLTYTQLGFIAFTLNIVSSVLQPIIGAYTDKKPVPYALPIGLSISMLGILGLAFSPSFKMVLFFVFFIGVGSAVFHPEGSRVAYMAAGSRRGLAQSIYQVGGNSGQALAPLITALVLVPLGQPGIVYFTLVAALAVILLIYIAKWYKVKLPSLPEKTGKISTTARSLANKKAANFAASIILFIIFARSWYGTSIASFYAFYVIEKYGVSIQASQGYVFLFLVMGAVGTFLGGPLADRFGKRTVIITSIMASIPLTFALPFAGPVTAYFLLALIGLILLSSFSVTVVYAQELFPGRIGTVSGLTIGFAFGMGAIGAVAIGALIDQFGLTTIMIAISLLPVLGITSYFLPTDKTIIEWQNNE
ncbi:MFS transporter [Jeotgalibacillus soli]|uniref:Fosmidomycin resistance protein n=1 Tax=Jeotgalibacillus soli TaxID=889306 RepID=A0A0C2V852_9BACL|nr:MFS transporter [Jeotgalibacillus soli]KIL45137.1 fosmidomycin resistance protein [Jeotgalibacillus soli]